MKKLLFFLLLFSEIAVAQNIVVSTNNKILNSDSKYYFPTISPDGNKITYTSENFKGLFVYDLETKKQINVSDKQGAGYNPVFSNDSKTIFYKWNEYEGFKKYSSIYAKNLIENKVTIIENKKRKISSPNVLNNKVLYTIGTKFKEVDVYDQQESNEDQKIWTCIENQKLIIYKNKDRIVLTPKGEGNYIWPELSPDKTKILFTFAGHGTFISDLEGNIITELGYLNASKWLNDNWIVGMKDKDNGEYVTDSDIYAIKANGENLTRLTTTDDAIEMYPNSSNNNIVYHTLAGDIYLMTINFK